MAIVGVYWVPLGIDLARKATTWEMIAGSSAGGLLSSMTWKRCMRRCAVRLGRVLTCCELRTNKPTEDLRHLLWDRAGVDAPLCL